MDFVHNLTGSGKPEGQKPSEPAEKKESGGVFSNIGDKLSAVGSGGHETQKPAEKESSGVFSNIGDKLGGHETQKPAEKKESGGFLSSMGDKLGGHETQKPVEKKESGGFLSNIGDKLGGHETQKPAEKKESGGFLSNMGDKLNAAGGGGRESEKDEDLLDKGVDFVQEKILGQGPQSNESAVEQAKDEQASDFIRGQYKKLTGSDVPIKDKEKKYGF